MFCSHVNIINTSQVSYNLVIGPMGIVVYTAFLGADIE